MARIVVGVDGSGHAQAALQWAVEEAELRGAALTVVYAHISYSTDFYGFTGGQLPAVSEAAEQQAQEVLDAVVGALGDRAAKIELETEVAHGESPPQALVDRATDADLLVVGSRGRGGLAGMLLGSVSQQVAQHAPCPVVIVRAS